MAPNPYRNRYWTEYRREQDPLPGWLIWLAALLAVALIGQCTLGF